MENRFVKAKAEVQGNHRKVDAILESERKQTYSFTLLPSERRMLNELAQQSSIRVSDSQFLGSIIREKYNEYKS